MCVCVCLCVCVCVRACVCVSTGERKRVRKSVCVSECVCVGLANTRTHTHARAFSLSFLHRSRYTGKTGFGRRAPLLGLGRKSRRTHCFKGIVPEVAAHVSVLLGVVCVGGGVAQPHASTAASTAPVERTLMSSSAGHGAPAVHF